MIISRSAPFIITIIRVIIIILIIILTIIICSHLGSSVYRALPRCVGPSGKAGQ